MPNSKTSASRPTFLLVAGSNGAGKTTFATEHLPTLHADVPFINADILAGKLSPGAPQLASVAAGRGTLREIARRVRGRKSFAVETTLSGQLHRRLVRTLKQKDWEIALVYLWIGSSQLAKQRIAIRVSVGGHNVPATDVDRRYTRSVANLRGVVDFCDRVSLFDNSETEPRLIAKFERGRWTVEDATLFDSLLPNVRRAK